MSPLNMLALSDGGLPPVKYAEDVFNSAVRIGDGATSNINVGFSPDLVLIKSVSSSGDWAVYDKARGATFDLAFNNTVSQTTQSQGLNSFNTDGFTVGNLSKVNTTSTRYIDTSFKKSEKFFDVVTFTLGSLSNRRISHGLGSVPAMIVLRRYDGSGNWFVYHKNTPTPRSSQLQLNNADAVTTNTNMWGTSDPTTTDFGISEPSFGTTGANFVAYIFADNSAADGLIRCGGYSGNGASQNIDCGWEVQYLIVKNITNPENWYFLDVARGMPFKSDGTSRLYSNSANGESTTGAGNSVFATQTGFGFNTGLSGVNEGGSSFIYLAVRKPNKPVISGTQVYNAIARIGSGVQTQLTGVGFSPDMIWSRDRTGSLGVGEVIVDKLRWVTARIATHAATTEAQDTTAVISPTRDGVLLGTDVTIGAYNNSGTSLITHFFKRAAEVLDIVCDTGTSSPHTIKHSLGVTPELMIRKSRSSGSSWIVYSANLTSSNRAYLETGNAFFTDGSAQNFWGNGSSSVEPTSSVFSVGSNFLINNTAENYITYLFATKAGISKVGSYVGNGTSQNIDCGFTTGARLVLIKRTDASGDWYLWDSIRGIVAGNDPHLSINTTSAEVTTDDSVDPYSLGITVNQVAATNINVNSATYIYLAFA